MRKCFHEREKIVRELEKCGEKEKALNFEYRNKLKNMNYSIKR